ncbi:ATP-binding protein [Aestuariivirga sp.]|uniref:ATP-binding protein n=1 Tax=Aestuariivirga sp. TaxID=2650926 RepID=UPI003018614C
MQAHKLQHDPTRLGTVEDVTGPTVSVKLSEDTAHGLLFVNGEGYRVGQVGSFVRIPGGYFDLYGIVSQVGAGAAPLVADGLPAAGTRWLRVELVGEGRRGKGFERGISQYPSIGDQAHVVTESDLRSIYAPGDEDAYIAVGRVASSESIRAYVNLNRLVSRHSAVVGSTGAGKSTAVASLLSAVSDSSRFPAARVVLLDLHGEYAKAFGDQARVFRVGADESKGERPLCVPFWALTAEELTAVAFGTVSGSANANIQESITSMKRAARPAGTPVNLPITDVTVDSPIPFCIHKLWYDLHCHHYATHSVGPSQNQTEATREYDTLPDGTARSVGSALNVERPHFKAIVAANIFKAVAAEQPRTHIDLLESKLRDPRLSFLFRPGDWTVSETGETTSDLDTLLNDWIGAEQPISVFDLSGIPTTVLDDLVGALLRILYDGLFWGRALPVGGRSRPLMVVLEEAHSYLGSQSKGRAASAARRIAKEGRKYGVGLMLVSQRPSEIDNTILAQCGTIVAMRLTNEADRSQIRSCSSDNLDGLFSMLPILRTGEALIVGEAVSMPVRALIDLPKDGRRPDSEDPEAVVRRGESGQRIRSGGWTEAANTENYATLVEAWRHQNPYVNDTATVPTLTPPTNED